MKTKKLFYFLLVMLMTSIFAIGTAASEISNETKTQPGDVKINGVTYRIGSDRSGGGSVGISPNNIVIIKQHTKAQIQQAEKALSAVMESVYIDKNSKLYQDITSGKVPEGIEKYNMYYKIRPDWDSMIPIYYSSMDEIYEAGKFTFRSKAILNKEEDTSIDYKLLYYMEDSNEFLGQMFLTSYEDGANPEGRFMCNTPYVTEDFRTHAVEIYACLKNTELDLSKTQAKLVNLSDYGFIYYLSDGKSEYIMPLGYQGAESPLRLLEEKYTTDEYRWLSIDAGANIKAVKMDLFLEINNVYKELADYYIEKYVKPIMLQTPEGVAPPTGGDGLIYSFYEEDLESGIIAPGYVRLHELIEELNAPYAAKTEKSMDGRLKYFAVGGTALIIILIGAGLVIKKSRKSKLA